MKKFMLLTPRNISPKGTIPRIHMPLGAIAVLSEAESAGYSVKLFDTSIADVNEDNVDTYFDRNAQEIVFDGVPYWRTGLKDDEIVKRIAQFSPDVLGISCCTVVDREDTRYLANLIGSNFPNIPLIVGGHEASHNFEDILVGKVARNYIPNVKCICLGLGQANIADVLDYVLNPNDRELPSGIAILYDGKVVSTPLKIIDINQHALFDYNLVDKVYTSDRARPYDVYSFIGNTHAGNIKRLSCTEDMRHISYFPIFTSYGCGNNCTFCDTDQYLLRYSVENVIKMIEHFECLFGIDYIDFMDNNFAGGNQESREICFAILEYIHSKKYKIGFSNGLTFESMMRNDFELLKTFEKYGNVTHIAFPCENGNARVLKMIRKPHTLEMIQRTLKFAKVHLSETNKEGFFIGGFPETLGQPAETPQEVENTVQFIKYALENQLLEQAIFLKLSPVTSMYRKMWEKKYANKSFAHCLFSKGVDIWPYDNDLLEDARIRVGQINQSSNRVVTRKL